MLVETGNYLGPARVVAVEPARLRVVVADEEVWAIPACPFFYQFRAGDLALAIGQDGVYYVVGILHGTGKTALSVPGDLDLSAANGTIRLVGREVDIATPRFSLKAGKIEMIARSVREKFESVSRWIRDRFRWRAGQVDAHVEDQYRLNAGRIVEQATGDVRIDGQSIDLG